MALLDWFIKRRVETVCGRVIAEQMPKIGQRIGREIVADMWRTDPLFRFIKWTQQRLQEANPTLPDKSAFYMAKGCIRQHLEDEEIEFGDPRFAWDRGGARELAEAYEIDHWERVQW